jgi:sugar fermentation stimulation protein A
VIAMMEIEKVFFKGKFIKRYKRFFVEFLFHQNIYTAHCPNTGSMETCLKEGADILFSSSSNPKRKLLYTFEMIDSGKSWILVNTLMVNKIIEHFFIHKHHLLKDFINRYQYLKREPKIENHKLDFLLYNQQNKNSIDEINQKFFDIENQKPLLIEVKNVTYYNERLDCLQFPDAKTQRGYEHLQLLIQYLKKGYDCMIIFVLSREEGSYFMPAYHIDPQFSKILKEFYKNGGKILPLRLSFRVENLNENQHKVLIDLKKVETLILDFY